MKLLPAAFLLVVMMLGGKARADGILVSDLRCEYTANPQDIDTTAPHLSWTVSSDARGQRQTAYQILAATSLDLLKDNSGDLWDSHKTKSNQTIQIAYAGKALTSGQRVYWKLRVWDMSDQASEYSEVAQFSTGLLNADDWQAKWIGYPGSGASATQNAGAAQNTPANKPDAAMPVFRKEFLLDKTPQRAMLYICGLGLCTATVNHQPATGEVLAPPWTDFKKTCVYRAYDVTSNLKAGANVLGVMLGNGLYNVERVRYSKFVGSMGSPKLIGQLVVQYADGTSQTIATDATWRTTKGPVTFSSFYGGEDFDARRLPDDWDQTGFSDKNWMNAELAEPAGTLYGSSHASPPIHVHKVLDPITIKQVKPNIWVYDFGQNCANIVRLVARGPVGKSIRLTPSELLNPDGTITQSSTNGSRYAQNPTYCQYTLRGEGDETWSPQFFYTACRYVQVEGALPPKTENPPDDAPLIVSLQLQAIWADVPEAGTFTCSNDLFNKTHTLVDWAIRSNMMSYFTDCPHREKLGWLEQTHLMGPSLMFRYDIPLIYRKMTADMADAQHPDGLVPDIAPEYTKFTGGFVDSPEWGSAALIVPWQVYQWYGDATILKNNYDMMQKYVAYLGTKATNRMLSHGLGDWYDIGPKPPGPSQLTLPALTATAFYYHDLIILARAARLLGKAGDAQEYEERALLVKAAFNENLYVKEKGYYKGAGTFSTSQAANAIPLVFDLVDADERPRVIDALVADIRAHANALTAGDVGYTYVLQALASAGRSDVIFDMNSRSDRPGYGYQLAHGATSLTEAWDARPSSSQNHFMLGHIMQWFYSGLAGINPDDAALATTPASSAGFAHFRLAPTPAGDVTWVHASYKSIRGTITSNWEKKGGRTTFDLVVPTNTTASLHLPTIEPASILESDKPLRDAQGAELKVVDRSGCTLELQSGHYIFSAATP